MRARDVMTVNVISVSPDMATDEIARLLLRNGISAAPVIDGNGAPIGMVSEGDLIGRDEAPREARRDWWLTLLAEGETLSAEFLASLGMPEHRASEIMSQPVITVGEETDVQEIATLLITHRIKRVPVVHEDRIVGIVSRADLLRGLAAGWSKPAAAPSGTSLAGALAGLDARFARAGHPDASDTAQERREGGGDDAGLMAAGFRRLVVDFKHGQAERRDEARAAADEQRRRRVAELIDEHVSDESWRSLLHKARAAAEHGEQEFMVLRFPSQLCSDGGRAINVTESG